MLRINNQGNNTFYNKNYIILQQQWRSPQQYKIQQVMILQVGLLFIIINVPVLYLFKITLTTILSVCLSKNQAYPNMLGLVD